MRAAFMVLTQKQSSNRPKGIGIISTSKIQEHVVLFGSKGVTDKDNAHQGQNVSQQYYTGFLRRLRNDISGKGPDKWRTQDWLMHHDKAPDHPALSGQQF
jgi:hypothetical protein